MIKHKKMPIVGAVMTSFPYFVEVDDTAAKMERMMDEHSIRHLPVQEKGEVIGIAVTGKDAPKPYPTVESGVISISALELLVPIMTTAALGLRPSRLPWSSRQRTCCVRSPPMPRLTALRCA